LLSSPVDGSVIGDPFATSTLALAPADDPAADPTPMDRDTDAIYNGANLFLRNVAVSGDVTGLAPVLAGCDPGLADTGTGALVLADVDTDGFVSAPDLVQDDEAHGLNVNSTGNEPVYTLVGGTPVLVENTDWALSLYLERGPACAGYDTALNALGSPPPAPALARAWGSLVDLSVTGSLAEADLLFGASMTAAYAAEPSLGVIPAGIVGYRLSFDLSTRAGTLLPLAGECGNDLHCDDGLACTGAETCNLSTRTCSAGTPLDCSALTFACGTGICVEPTGCAVDPEPDGTPCDDGSFCTGSDVCSGGQCVGTTGSDSDGDGYCDEHEAIFGCDPLDPAIIPPQPAAYSGNAKTLYTTLGEVLLTYAAPERRDVHVPADPSCAQVGQCGAFQTCTVGKIGDACAQDADCDQPPNTCRVIMNYAMAPDMVLRFARIRPPLGTDMSAPVVPLAPGCSRKFDVSPPAFSDKGLSVFRIKVRGTAAGRFRRDRDRIVFHAD
jgi:hypothetical protein